MIENITLYICCSLFGVLIGNFATTFVYRLPNKIKIYGFDTADGLPPFCSVCKHPLKFYEFLPILSWFSTLGKCNYCGVKIDKSYTALEVLAGGLSVCCYHFFGFSDNYLLLFSIGILMLVQLFIYLKHRSFEFSVILLTVMISLLYRTLEDGTIMEWIDTFCTGCFISMIVFKNGFFTKSICKELCILFLLSSSLLKFSLLFLFWLPLLLLIIVFTMMKKEFKQLYSISLISLFFMVCYYAK